MPRTYFQCSKLTLSGSNPLGAKLPLRKEAETTMRYGTRTNASRAISTTWEIPSRSTVFCWEFINLDFHIFCGDPEVYPGQKPDQDKKESGDRAGQPVVRTGIQKRDTVGKGDEQICFARVAADHLRTSGRQKIDEIKVVK